MNIQVIKSQEPAGLRMGGQFSDACGMRMASTAARPEPLRHKVCILLK